MKTPGSESEKEASFLVSPFTGDFPLQDPSLNPRELFKYIVAEFGAQETFHVTSSLPLLCQTPC